MIDEQKILETLHANGFRIKNIIATNMFHQTIDEVLDILGEKTKKKMITRLRKTKRIDSENPYVYYHLTQHVIKKEFNKFGSSMILDALKNLLEKKIGYYECKNIQEILEIISKDEILRTLEKRKEKVLCIESKTHTQKFPNTSKIKVIKIAEINECKLNDIVSTEKMILIKKPLCLLQKNT